eukprot:6186277-Pleurochrysis_carterae.AAC.1
MPMSRRVRAYGRACRRAGARACVLVSRWTSFPVDRVPVGGGASVRCLARTWLDARQASLSQESLLSGSLGFAV